MSGFRGLSLRAALAGMQGALATRRNSASVGLCETPASSRGRSIRRSIERSRQFALKQLINVGVGGETLGTPDRGLLYRASFSCGYSKGAESPRAGRCWQAADKGQRGNATRKREQNGKRHDEAGGELGVSNPILRDTCGIARCGDLRSVAFVPGDHARWPPWHPPAPVFSGGLGAFMLLVAGRVRRNTAANSAHELEALISTIWTASSRGRGGSSRGSSPLITHRQNFFSAVSNRCWYGGSA